MRADETPIKYVFASAKGASEENFGLFNTQIGKIPEILPEISFPPPNKKFPAPNGSQTVENFPPPLTDDFELRKFPPQQESPI